MSIFHHDITLVDHVGCGCHNISHISKQSFLPFVRQPAHFLWCLAFFTVGSCCNCAACLFISSTITFEEIVYWKV